MGFDVNYREATDNCLLFRKITECRRAIWVDNRRPLALKPTTGYPNTRSLGVTKHAMGGFAHSFQVALEKVHRTIIERDEITSHTMTLLG